MGTVLVIPVGVTKETVQGVLSTIGSDLLAIISVTTTGLESMKEEIIVGVRAAAELVGASFYHVTVERGDRMAGARLYRVIKKLGPDRIIVSGITGSRYLYPIIIQSLLRYWYETGADILLVHGVEGEEWSLQPLPGFCTYDLKREQLRVFKLIYGDPRDTIRSKEDLIEKYGFTRTIYKVLGELEAKGLIRRGRNRISKTLPGHLLYNILREAGVI